MSSDKWLALVAWALLPAVATTAAAQENHQHASGSAAAVSAGATGYQSAFADYRAFKEEETVPDKIWRSANDEMGTLGGHAGHIKDAPAVARPAAQNTTSATTPGASGQNPAAANQSGGMDHMHHHKHHGGGH